MRMTLHRVDRTSPLRAIGDTGLLLTCLARGWKVLSESPCHPWLMDRPEIRAMFFARRRELLDYLEARMAVEPCPGQALLPAGRLLRDGSGGYRVLVDGQEMFRVRPWTGGPGWKVSWLESDGWRVSGQVFVSLYMVRRYLGTWRLPDQLTP